MFRQMLYVQWKSVRLGLLPLAVLALALPLLSVQGLGPTGPGASVETVPVWWILESQSAWAWFFPALAFVVGMVLGLNAWLWDHRTEHVYALSLPLARWAYVLLKLGAGGVLLLGVSVFFAAGTLAAAVTVELPAGLHAYPLALAARFVLAALLSYAFLFALASATIRTVVVVLSVVVGLFIAAAVVNPLLTEAVPGIEQWTLPWRLYAALVEWPGPFSVFLGNWMLVDV